MDELSRLDITKKQLNNVARMLQYRYTSNAFPSINEVEYNEISEKWNDNISQSQIEYIIEQKNMKICVIFNIKDKLDGDLVTKLKNKNRTFIIIMPRTASANTIKKETIKVLDYTNVEIFDYEYFMYDRSSYVDCASQKHTICTKDEKEDFMTRYRVDTKQIATISMYDPMIYYINATLGDLIKIKRMSETVGTSYFYRIVSYPSKRGAINK
tara:strand:+ start:57 stop:692 length:636 start_codon:yes stop_codon:yes gene_type:complete